MDTYWPIQACKFITNSPQLCSAGTVAFDTEALCCNSSFPGSGCGPAPNSQVSTSGTCFVRGTSWPERTCKTVTDNKQCLRGERLLLPACLGCSV